MSAPLGVRFARHYFDASDPEGPTACGGNSYGFGAVSNRFDAKRPVTCKRCLASLAKRDREFQRKARRGIAHNGPIEAYSAAWSEHARYPRFAEDAARAIASEEGRAL